MNSRKLLRSACASVATLMLCTSGQATVTGLFRAYVASGGNDANPCTLAQPCRLLPAALAAVADGGEIWMLDSANFNTAPVVITKSVSIMAIPGAVGSVLAIGGPAISITASTLTIALRNLVIVPFPGSGGTNGVEMTGASALTIENSLIANLPSDGVHVSGAGKVGIANTTLRNNGAYAVRVQNGASADISSTKMLNNLHGVLAYSFTATTTTATLSDSIIAGGGVVGGSEGAHALTTIAGAVANIFLTRCTIQSFVWALESETTGVGTALVAVSYSMITNNHYSWNQTGAGSAIRTLGNNHLTDNVTFTGSLTTSALQ